MSRLDIIAQRRRNLASPVAKIDSLTIGPVDSKTVEIDFNVDIESPSMDYTLGVTIKVDGMTRTITAAARQADNSIVRYTIAGVFGNESVTWEYNSDVGDLRRVSDSEDLVTVNPQNVGNSTFDPSDISTLILSLDAFNINGNGTGFSGFSNNDEVGDSGSGWVDSVNSWEFVQSTSSKRPLFIASIKYRFPHYQIRWHG